VPATDIRRASAGATLTRALSPGAPGNPAAPIRHSARLDAKEVHRADR